MSFSVRLKGSGSNRANKITAAGAPLILRRDFRKVHHTGKSDGEEKGHDMETIGAACM